MRFAACVFAVLLSWLPASAQDADGVPYLNAAWLEELPGNGFGYRCLIRVNEVRSDRLDLALQFKLAGKDGASVREKGTDKALLLWPERWVRERAPDSGIWRPSPVSLEAEFFKRRADLPPGTYRIEAVFDIYDPGASEYVESGYARRATFTYTLSEDGTAALENEGTVPTVLSTPVALAEEEVTSILWDYGSKPIRVLGTLRLRAGRPAFDGTLAFGGGGILTGYPGGKIRVWDKSTGALKRETTGSFVYHANFVSLILSPRGGLHDPESGKLVMGLEGGTPPALAARISADGAQIFVLGADSFTVWNLVDGTKVRDVRLIRSKGENGAGQGRITPCGRLAAIAGVDGKRSRMDVFDTSTGKPVLKTTAIYGASAMLTVAKDGKTFAAPVYEWNGDNGVALFDASTGERKSLISGTMDVRALTLSPDGKHLAVGGGGLALHEMGTGELVRRLEVSGAVTGLSFSLDGGLLCAATGYGARIFDVSTGRLLAKGGPPGPTALYLDGSKAVTLPWSGDLVVWDLRTGNPLVGYPQHERMDFSADGSRVASLAADGTVRVWDVASGSGIFAMKATKGPFRLGPKGRRLAAGYCGTAPVLWDLDEGTVLFAPRERGDGKGYDVAFSPDGKHVGVAWGDKRVRVYDLLRHAVVTGGQLETHARCLVFSPDGTRLGMEAQYGLVQADVAPDAPFRQTLKARSSEWLAYSPDGARVAIGGEPPAVYDAKSGERLLAMQIERISVPRFLFSPDGKRLLTIRDQEWIAVFDTADGKLLRTMKGDLRLCAAAFSPDGKSLHTVVENGAVVTWKWE